MRADLAIIADWIRPGSSILDMGCGDGTLLKFLRDNREVDGIGLEIDAEQIENCVRDSISVIQSDLNDGLAQYFSDNSFDYVVMSQTLQAMERPNKLVEEMLRVGKQGIITFPNMAYWKGRLQLGIRGIMPITSSLPNQWFDTPNIHLCTLNDFEALCKQKNINILERTVVDHTHRKSTLLMRLFPNLFGEIAIYRFCRNSV